MDKHMKTLALCHGIGDNKIAIFKKALDASGLTIVPKSKAGMTIMEMADALRKKGYKVML